MTDNPTRKGANRGQFLTAGLAAGGAAATASVAHAAGDPAILEIKPWAQELGEGVDARPYGTPSEFEKHVVRRNVPWLTADPVSSVNFTPLHRSEEHTSELQSRETNSYAGFFLKKKFSQHIIQLFPFVLSLLLSY